MPTSINRNFWLAFRKGALLRSDLRDFGAMLMLDRLPQLVDGVGDFQFRDIPSRVARRLRSRRTTEGRHKPRSQSAADDVSSFHHAVPPSIEDDHPTRNVSTAARTFQVRDQFFT
jgi:hypothetical protein